MGIATFLLSVLLSRAAGFVEAVYGERIGPALSLALSRITGVLPFSVAELVLIAFLAARLGAATRALHQVVRRSRRIANALLAGLLRVLSDAGVVVTLFYVLWGFQYARPRLEQRLEWPQLAEVGPESLVDLTVEMIDAANDAYVELHRAPDAGSPTRLEERAAIDAPIERGWRAAARALGLSDPVTARYGPAKRLVFSALLDRLGISGFYFPFTGEANVNRGIPAVAYPQVVAHEKSHQRGVGPENEANFFGFLAAAHAPDALARYSAFLFAQRQLLQALLRVDRDLAIVLLDRRLPGVQRDVDDLVGYWARHRGRTHEVVRSWNDAYLRTNRVEGGVASYGRSAQLMLVYSRTRGGTLR